MIYFNATRIRKSVIIMHRKSEIHLSAIALTYIKFSYIKGVDYKITYNSKKS